MSKTAKMSEFLDISSMNIYGRSRSECLSKNTCVSCGNTADKFDSDVEKREYKISALCSSCQKEIFK